MAPLTAATSTKKGTVYKWTEEMDKAFKKIKDEIVKDLTLTRPDWDAPFQLYCDASGITAGFCLAQKGKIKPRLVLNWSSPRDCLIRKTPIKHKIGYKSKRNAHG